MRIPPLLVTGAFAGMMWCAAVLTPSLTVAMPGKKVVAILCAVAGVVVALMGVVAFRRAATTVNPVRPRDATSLVTGGIYRYTRNPMYLGFLLLLLAWGVWLAHVLACAIIPLFVVFMNRFQIAAEEHALRDRFGDSFASYLRSTRRWL